MLGTQIINRYNTLLIKFADNPEFLELIALARNYYDICNVEHGNKNTVYSINNPYDRLIADLLVLEDERKR